MFSYFFGKKDVIDPDDISVSVAESVTAGAVCNSLCSEPGASKYFKGGVIAYSIDSKQEILGIDMKLAEQHNYATTFTTVEMAKAAVKLFKTRYGIATTGYSSPYHRAENKEKNEHELHIETPYTYICIYDALTDTNITIRHDFKYNPNDNKASQRANIQARTAIIATKMYNDLVAKNKRAT